jgi:lysophospholipase L1-like esterase
MAGATPIPRAGTRSRHGGAADLHRFGRFARLALAEIRIVALGDSGIYGQGVGRNETYPAKLDRALKARGHDVSVVNAGSNGDTTQGVLNRLDSAVPQGTQIVVLSVGVNDVVQFGIDAKTMFTSGRCRPSRGGGLMAPVFEFLANGRQARTSLASPEEAAWKAATVPACPAAAE